MNNEGLDVQKDKNQPHKLMVPKLRFPEFREAGEWPSKPLNCIAKRKTRRNTDQKISRVLTNSAEHGVVDQRDFFEKDIAVPGNLANYFVVDEGDFVYNPRISSLAPVGPIGKNRVGKGVMSPLYTVFGFDGANESFYEHFFGSALWHGYMRSVSNTGARHDRMAISNDDFMAMPVPAPSTMEQQKVTACLSSLDEVIASEGDRLTALRKYKKGLLQQLFPRPERVENGEKVPSETFPRLRFPEFQDAGEWTEWSLGELLDCPPAYGANAAAVPYDERLPTYLRITDISDDGKFIDGAKMSVNVTANEANSMLPNDIALARTGASVGKAYLHTKANGPLVFAGFLIRIRPNRYRVLSELVFQYMQTPAYWSWVAKTSVRSGQPGINGGEYASLKIPLPPNGENLEEQQRIADCLSSLDDLVSTLTSKIAALKAHKAGLVQRLFPSADKSTT